MSFRSSPWQRLFFLCPAAALFLTQAGGQQPQAAAEMTTKDAPITFSSAVNLVLVPVVARDAQGHAVGNLQKEDFQLFDKGKLQVISKFSIEKAEAPPILPDTSVETDADGNVKTKPPGTAAAEPVAAHFIAWLFDDLHLSFDDLARVRVAALKVLDESFEPGMRAAIYTTSGKTILDFTEDKDKLRATMNQIRPWPSHVAGDADCPDISYYQADLIINHNDQDALLAGEAEYVACAVLATKTSTPTAADIAAMQATAEAQVRVVSFRELSTGSQETYVSLDVL